MHAHDEARRYYREVQRLTGLPVARAHMATMRTILSIPEVYRPDVLLAMRRINAADPGGWDDLPDDAPGGDDPDEGPYANMVVQVPDQSISNTSEAVYE